LGEERKIWWTLKIWIAIIRRTSKRGGELNVVNLMLLGFLTCAVYTDMTQTRISNRLIVLGLMIGFVFRLWSEGLIGVFFFTVNIFIPVILLFLLFQMRALGAGDIKLFSMLGAFISTEQLLKLMVLAFCVGALLGICTIIYQFIFRKYELGKLTQVHFSPAILIAYLLVVGGDLWLR